MQANREASWATDLKANSEEMESEDDHWEIPKGCAAVKPVGGLTKRHRGRKPKELTRGDCGTGRKLIAACRKVSRRAAMAWCKVNVFRVGRYGGVVLFETEEPTRITSNLRV
jgi:hypothetical protein